MLALQGKISISKLTKMAVNYSWTSMENGKLTITTDYSAVSTPKTIFKTLKERWNISTNHQVNQQNFYKRRCVTITYTESDIQLNYGKSGQDLDLTFTGCSKVNGNGIHKLGGLASILRKNGEIFGEGNIDYHHKPTSKHKIFLVNNTNLYCLISCVSSLNVREIQCKKN